MATSLTFERLKARYCLGVIVLAWYIQPGVNFLQSNALKSQWYWHDLISLYYGDFVIALFVVVAAYASKLDVQALFGRTPRRSDIWPVVVTDVFLYCVGEALITLIFTSVSFLYPKFAIWWLNWTWEPSVYITTEGSLPLFANSLNFLSLVVLGPALEEILFRGYLLHRWSRKWGLGLGIFASSAIFGAIHPDPLGAAIFGVGMSLLYLRTQSLYVPILAHSIYNLGVWFRDLYGVLDEGIDYYRYELEQFQSDWWIGVVGAILAILIADVYIRRAKLGGPHRLPPLK